VAGVVCFLATQYIKQKLKIDDSLDVFPVHGVGGIIGTFMAGIFASSSIGIFSGQGYANGNTMVDQLGIQLIGIFSTLIYTAVLTFVLLKVVNLITGFRVSVEEETTGLDIVLHDERGYDL
jgi:Amt family ammonium transporter